MKGFLKGLAIALVLIAVLALTMTVGKSPSVNTAEAQLLTVATGTVASSLSTTINVPVGFTPRMVTLTTNTTTAGATARAYWQSQMPKGAMMLELNTSQSYTLVNGIAPYTGSTTTAPGFSIGTNTSINNGGDTIFWQAFQ